MGTECREVLVCNYVGRRCNYVGRRCNYVGRRCNYGGGARGVIMWEVYRMFN